MAQREIVVTGGGTGIGKAVANWFAAQGDRVSVVGRRGEVVKRAAAELGGTAIIADLATTSGAERLANSLPGPVAVLINNAGGNPDLQGLERPAGLEGVRLSWQDNFEANVLTAVLATAALRERIVNDGRVITLGSIAAWQGAGSYGAAKAAIEAWNLSLAAELGSRRITCNVVAPGLIKETEFFADALTPEREAALIDQTATGRAGVPADIAEVIGWLASPAASHVTSQVIHVNGGAWSGR